MYIADLVACRKKTPDETISIIVDNSYFSHVMSYAISVGCGEDLITEFIDLNSNEVKHILITLSDKYLITRIILNDGTEYYYYGSFIAQLNYGDKIKLKIVKDFKSKKSYHITDYFFNR